MIPAIILFAATYVLMLTFSKYRPYIALTSGLIFVLTQMLPLNQILPALDFNVLLMIGGTMGLVQLFIDNIPYVATMIPVIGGLAAQMAPALGVDPTLVGIPLYFGLLSGATLGGNITPIGASANITAIGILRKECHEVANADFFKIGIPFTLFAIIPAYIYIWLVYGV